MSVEAVYEFRCKIAQFTTHEFDVVKVLNAVYYDANWDRDIENRTMQGGYQIRNAHLTDICNTEMEKFMGEVVTEAVKQYLASEYARGGISNNLELPPIAIDLVSYWINVMPPGAWHTMHTHPNANLSGVFYLQAPEGCGDLFVPSPYTTGIETIIQTVPEFMFKPVVRQGYLWPSSLPHAVGRNESDEDRVSISFNLKLKNV